MKPIFKFSCALGISTGLFIYIYGYNVLSDIQFIISEASILWLCAMMVFLAPIMILGIWRWHCIVRHEYQQSFLYNSKIYLSSKAFNLFIPSKLGDFSRSYFLKKDNTAAIDRSVALIFFERILDVSVLCLLLIAGLFVSKTPTDIQIIFGIIAFTVIISIAVVAFISDKLNFLEKTNFKILNILINIIHAITSLPYRISFRTILMCKIYSLLLWTLHLCHFWIMFRVFQTDIILQDIFTFIPIVIFAGMIPFTIGGLGTRDAALVYFFSDKVLLSVLAGVGILSLLRVIVPSLIGIVVIIFLRPKIKNEEKKNE